MCRSIGINGSIARAHAQRRPHPALLGRIQFRSHIGDEQNFIRGEFQMRGDSGIAVRLFLISDPRIKVRADQWRQISLERVMEKLLLRQHAP